MYIYNVCILLRFYKALFKFLIGPKVVVIETFSIMLIFFSFLNIIWYEIYFDYLVVNEW